MRSRARRRQGSPSEHAPCLQKASLFTRATVKQVRNACLHVRVHHYHYTRDATPNYDAVRA